MPVIEVRNLSKTYALGSTTVEAVRGVDLVVAEGEFACLWGPSGSGKSSLLHLLGLLDQPSGGTIVIDGRPVERLSEDEAAAVRNEKIGFVFQTFNLLPALSALENVAMPLIIRGRAATAAEQEAAFLLDKVGLGAHMDHPPDKLSGGQRQRVAIARALVTRPLLVLADEPTAALDSTTAREILKLMRSLNDELGTTFLFATHDANLLSRVKRKIEIRDGRVAGEEQLQ
jgi:putative ABC transport system ATP-binding protein